MSKQIDNAPLIQKIRPHTKRNGRVFITLGAGGLALLLLINAQLVLPWPLHLTLSGLCLIVMALGIGKIIEPETSLEITPQAITYFHFRGSWHLPWENVVRFDIPDVQRGLGRQKLPFLGVRLRHYDAFLEQLSPRLAVHLVHQQRPLMLQALRSEMPAHREYMDYVDDPDIYLSDSGKRYRGVIATFAMRMELMREMLGYDLYISQNALDRPLEDFISHLKALQATRMQHFDDEQ